MGGASSGFYSPVGRPAGTSRRHGWFYLGLLAFLAIVGAAVVLAVFFPGSAPHFGFWFPVGLFWGLLWILFFVWFIGWAFRWSWWGGWYGPRRSYRWYGGDGAAAIARERYARGEITREQFDTIMRDLEERPR